MPTPNLEATNKIDEENAIEMIAKRKNTRVERRISK
jgi:hypothetical protein